MISIIRWGWVTIICFGCSSGNNSEANDILSASALKVSGRSVINEQGLGLITSAAHFGFSFEGKECRVYAFIPDVQAHGYLQYEMDGVYQNRIRVSGSFRDPILLTAATEGKHTVWIYKATEAHTGPIYIREITGLGIHSLQKPQAPLIEFIGNSITCGAAADASEVPCGKGEYHDQHNAYYAYGPRVARELGTDFVLSSVSGIGIYRNWNSDGPTMPQAYEKLNFQEGDTQLWDFREPAPAVVSIALGTNDFSNGDGVQPRRPFDSAVFVSQYIGFVKSIQSRYPRSQVALLSSPMIHGPSRLIFQNCLKAVKKKVDALAPSAKPIALYFFAPMEARGCTGHPSVEDHAILARELVPFFKTLIP